MTDTIRNNAEEALGGQASTEKEEKEKDSDDSEL